MFVGQMSYQCKRSVDALVYYISALFDNVLFDPTGGNIKIGYTGRHFSLVCVFSSYQSLLYLFFFFFMCLDFCLIGYC